MDSKSSLKAAINADRSNLEHIDLNTPSLTIPPLTELQPGYSSITRCPLPPINATPDSLRTFYLGGKVPQMRLFPPSVSSVQSGSGGTGTTNVSSTVNSTSVTNVTQIIPTNASVSSPILAPNVYFTTAILFSNAFQLLSVSTSSAARIALYGTQDAQATDVGRPVNVSPPFASAQNIISDVYLDTAPWVWSYQNRVGANADTPQQAILYITITNIDLASVSITATINYLPIEG
jgi:hypothetical protein